MTDAEAHFLVKLFAFQSAAGQLRDAWQALESATPERAIPVPSPFPMAFDDWFKELDRWAQAVRIERFGLPIKDLLGESRIGLKQWFSDKLAIWRLRDFLRRLNREPE